MRIENKTPVWLFFLINWNRIAVSHCNKLKLINLRVTGRQDLQRNLIEGFPVLSTKAALHGYARVLSGQSPVVY